MYNIFSADIIFILFLMGVQPLFVSMDYHQRELKILV